MVARSLVWQLSVAWTLAAVGLSAHTAMAINSTAISVSNLTARTFVVTGRNLYYGRWDVGPGGTLASLGQMQWSSITSDFMQGVEGWVTFGGLDGKSFIRFYWDNPFIGSNSYRVDASGDLDVVFYSPNGGSGQSASVSYTIKSKTVEFKTESVPLTGPGTVSGTVRWAHSEGAPAFGGAYWEALSMQALAPTTYNALFAPTQNVPTLPNESDWQGQRGYFSNLVPVGQVSFRQAATLPAGYFGFDYTISGLPVTSPVQLVVKVIDTVPWPPDPSNAPPLGLLNPVYKHGVVPLGNLSFTIWPDRTAITGDDFGVVGVWGSNSANGGGQAGVTVDAASLIAHAKSMAINPNPMLALRLRLAPSMRRTTVLEQQGQRVLIGPQIQIQRGNIKQLAK